MGNIEKRTCEYAKAMRHQVKFQGEYGDFVIGDFRSERKANIFYELLCYFVFDETEENLERKLAALKEVQK